MEIKTDIVYRPPPIRSCDKMCFEEEKKYTHFQFLQLDIRSRKAALGTFYIKKSFFKCFSRKSSIFLAREKEIKWEKLRFIEPFISPTSFSLLPFMKRNRREGAKHIPKEKVKEFQRLLAFVVVRLNLENRVDEKFHDDREKKFHCTDRSRGNKKKLHATVLSICTFDESADLFKFRIGGLHHRLCGVFFSLLLQIIAYLIWWVDEFWITTKKNCFHCHTHFSTHFLFHPRRSPSNSFLITKTLFFLLLSQRLQLSSMLLNASRVTNGWNIFLNNFFRKLFFRLVLSLILLADVWWKLK